MRDPLLETLRNNENEDNALDLLEAELNQDHPTQLYRLLREDWESSTINSTPTNVQNEIWQKLVEEISQPEESKSWGLQKWMPLIRRVAMPIAAITVLAFGLNFLLSSGEAPSLTQTQQSNNEIQAKKVNLGNGISCWLSKGSSLNYDRNLVGNAKSVQLSGEAYFEMPSDSSQAFNIQAGLLRIEAFGAKLNIEARTNDEQIRVSVLEGEVNIYPLDKFEEEYSRINTIAGDEIRYHLADHLHTVYTVDTSGILAWKNAGISFNNHSLAAAFNKLNTHFDVNIQYSSEAIKNCKTNQGPKPMLFQPNAKIEKILSSLLKRKKLRYKKEGEQIVITGNGC